MTPTVRRIWRVNLIAVPLVAAEYAVLYLLDPNRLASALIDWASATEGVTPWW